MSTPMDWQPSKAIQAKTGAIKKTIPRWIEDPKGRSRQEWDDERNKRRKKKKKKQTCKSIDHRCDVRSTYETVPTSSNTTQLFFSIILQLPTFKCWSRCIFERLHPQKRNFLRIYVRARAITCPIFQCFVCLCEIVSTNCQPSCIPKHSYMHNHASYVFMHSIKLLCYSYASAFSIPMLISTKINHVHFKFLLLAINVYCHVNFKVQQSCQHSCQIQAPAVMSIKFNSFSNVICFC